MNMDDLHLKVYGDRSELIRPEVGPQIFFEGPTSSEAKQRYKKIAQSLEQGFLWKQIELCRDEPSALELQRLSLSHTALLDKLVASLTSEVGRALIGLTVMQLCVKAIEPAQSIRLHKAGNTNKDFSWREGISMRSLDKNYITPTLRRYHLLKMNADGFMMTRSLAENYPYSKVYKAAIRGARGEWAAIVEAIEAGEMQAKAALQYLLSQLLNHASQFQELASQALKSLGAALAAGLLDNKGDVLAVIKSHITKADYAARIMEIAMHALGQAMQETMALGSLTVKPLSQMRSANKKHGNIGDIEFLDGGQIVEAWDAKYGKSYLRDELEELNDKLPYHTSVSAAGFVTSDEPERLSELETRRADIAEAHSIQLEIMTLDAWVEREFGLAEASGVTTEEELSQLWIKAYTESLAQLRPEIAPIDEPCYQWLDALSSILTTL